MAEFLLGFLFGGVATAAGWTIYKRFFTKTVLPPPVNQK